MGIQNLLDAVEVVCWRQKHAAGAHHRLGNEGRDRIAALARNQRLKVGNHAIREFLFAFSWQTKGKMMRARGVQYIRDRQVESLVIAGNARQAA